MENAERETMATQFAKAARDMIVWSLIVGVAPASAQPRFGNVKAWVGTITIDATQSRQEAGQRETTTITASGEFVIADEAMPAGAHQQWPLPNPASAGDGQKYMEGFKRWAARATVAHELKGVDELGQPVSRTCAAEQTVTRKVQLIAGFMMPHYELTIEPPYFTDVPCRGNEFAQRRTFGLGREIVLRLPATAPPLTGSQTLSLEGMTVRVTYKLTPK
jgi:hypothetical protein